MLWWSLWVRIPEERPLSSVSISLFRGPWLAQLGSHAHYWAGRRGFVMGSSNVIPVVKERHAGEWRSADVRCSGGAGILSWTTGAGSYFDHYHLHFPPLHLKMSITWSCYKTLFLCCSCKYSHLGSILLVSCYLSTAAKAMQRLACPSASPLLHGGSEQTFSKEPPDGPILDAMSWGPGHFPSCLFAIISMWRRSRLAFKDYCINKLLTLIVIK